MKLIRAIFPVGERNLWMAVIFESIGLISLQLIACSRTLPFGSMKKNFSGAKVKDCV